MGKVWQGARTLTLQCHIATLFDAFNFVQCPLVHGTFGLASLESEFQSSAGVGSCKETSRSVEKKTGIYNCFLAFQPSFSSSMCTHTHTHTTHTHTKIMLMFNLWASLIFFIVDQPISGLPPLLLKNEALRTSLVVQHLRLCSQGRRPRFDPWSGN